MTDIPDNEQKILAEMPLHAITAVYGEQGLRARLAIETGRLDDAAGRRRSAKRWSWPGACMPRTGASANRTSTITPTCGLCRRGSGSCWWRPCSPRKGRHNQRASRKARSWSGGR